MEEGFFQFVEGGEFLLIDGFEAAGFDLKIIQGVNNSLLF